MTQLSAAVKWCVESRPLRVEFVFVVELGTVCGACGTWPMFVAVFRNSTYIYIYVCDGSNFLLQYVNCTAHFLKNKLRNCRFTFNGVK
jgi:hypothetical protein